MLIPNLSIVLIFRHGFCIQPTGNTLVVAFEDLILLSFGGNIWQLNRNSQLKDNDLRYRYIKSTNGITLENLYKLEDIFQYNRDKKLIREIKKEVEEYERDVQKVVK